MLLTPILRPQIPEIFHHTNLTKRFFMVCGASDTGMVLWPQSTAAILHVEVSRVWL